MSWPVVTLESLASDEPRAITDGPFGSNLARQHYTATGPRVIRLQNIGDGQYIDNPAHISEAHFERLRAHEVLPGDLLVASLGEVLPRGCLAPSHLGRAIVKADCIRVRLARSVDPKWVLYSLQRPSVRRWADDQRHGVGRPRLGLGVIRRIPVPLPTIEEQRRIVAILEEHLSDLDDGDRALDRATRRLTALREQRVHSAITGSNLVGRRAPGIQAAGTHDGDLPSLPLGWEWRRLGDVADVVGGITKDSKKQSDASLPEVPYLRVANVQRGRLDLRSITTIRVPEARARALALHPGDVLLNEGGDRDKLARGWVWEGQIDGCIHQNHVFRARVTERRLDPYFLSLTTNSLGASWAERNGKQSVNLASISLSMIKKMPVIVPPDGVAAGVVRAIRDEAESFDRLEQAIGQADARSSRLRRALLAAAFSGRLTGCGSDTDVLAELADQETA